MESQPEPNHTVGWRTEWQVWCCCVAWNFIRKTQPANALMFLSVFKGCLECHQSSCQKWKCWGEKNTPNRHFKVEKSRTERTTDELKRIFKRLFSSSTEHNINCLCLLSGNNKKGGKVHWKKGTNLGINSAVWLLQLCFRDTHCNIKGSDRRRAISKYSLGYERVMKGVWRSLMVDVAWRCAWHAG